MLLQSCDTELKITTRRQIFLLGLLRNCMHLLALKGRKPSYNDGCSWEFHPGKWRGLSAGQTPGDAISFLANREIQPT